MVDVTARDVDVRPWVSPKEYETLLRAVESGFEVSLGAATPYFQCLDRVDRLLVDLAKKMDLDVPYASGQISHAVWMSLNENLRSPVRQHLLSDMIQRGHVRYNSADLTGLGDVTANTSVYPGLYRYFVSSPRELTLTERRRVYAKLPLFFDEILDTVDTVALEKTVRARLSGKLAPSSVTIGNRRLPGVKQLWEDGRDSFRIEQDGDGLTHHGERVVAEVTRPTHSILRRQHHVYRNEHRTQYNFVVEIPVVLLLPRGIAVTVPYAVLDLTIQTKEVHLEATRGCVRRLAVGDGLQIHTLNALGWCRREVASGNPGRAGAFFAFWWMEQYGETKLADLDRLCETMKTSWPGPVCNILKVERTPDDPGAFYSTMRSVVDSLLASYMLDPSSRAVTFVTPDTVQDTFY